MEKSIPIKRRILVWSLVLILLITLIYTATLVSSGLLERIKDSQYKALYYPVKNRGDEIETQMYLAALKAGSIAERIDSAVKSSLELNNMSLNDISDRKVIDSILRTAFPSVLEATRILNISGAFIVLDTSIYGDGIHRAGIRIEDCEPWAISTTNGDLLYSRGPTEFAKRYNIAMDSSWSYEYDLSADTDGSKRAAQLDFFRKPYRAARPAFIYGHDGGYWSRPYLFSQDGGKIVSYSIALVDEIGMPYGVFGIDLSEDYISKMMPAKDINYKDSLYILGSIDEEAGIIKDDWYIKSGNASPLFASLLDEKPVFEPAADVSSYGIRKADLKNNYYKSVFASSEPINIYSTNSPFKDEKWHLVGFAPKRELMAVVNGTVIAMVFSVILTIVLGTITLLKMASKYTKRIITMADKVKNHDYTRPIVLENVGIAEIDELACALEVSSGEVMESAKRLSLTMDLVSDQIGCFEENRDAGRVFLTDSLFRILEIEKGKDSDNFITIEEWKGIVGSPANCFDFQYVTPNTRKNRWLRIKTGVSGKKVYGLVMDITREVFERKRLEQERDLDVLTGLYNRRAFQTLASEALAENMGAVGALLFLDIDNLKHINDVYGHDIGDKYIKCAADNIRQFAQSNAVMARISGDEFAIYIHGYSSKEELENLIQRKVKEFKASLRLPDNSVQKVRASMGIAYYPYDSDNINDLMRFADFAMYEVKHNRKGSLKEFDKVSYEKDYYLLDKGEAFNNLVENKLIYFDFQPIVDTKSADIMGYEALMRPSCSDFKTPYEVISIARANAKLYEIEKLTMFKVLDYVRESSKVLGGKKIFFNSISNQELSREDIEKIEAGYFKYLSSLVVELTEGDRINKKNKTEVIKLFQRGGGEIAIDDYGSGYSNHSTLISISPDYVKIDMLLVRDIDRDTHKQQLVASIIEYTRDNGIKTIAEGVETFEEMKALIDLKVDYLQGFYLGKPKSRLEDIGQGVKEEIISLARTD